MLQITKFIIKKKTKREAYAIGSKESQKVKGLKLCNILDLFSILCFPGCYTIGHNILIYIYTNIVKQKHGLYLKSCFTT